MEVTFILGTFCNIIPKNNKLGENMEVTFMLLCFTALSSRGNIK